VIYEALDQTDQSRCAVKVFKSKAGSQPDGVKRFRREVQLGVILGGHDSIVEIRDSGALGSGQLYAIMELIDGKPLDQWVASGVATERAVRVSAEIARAVAFAHDRGVIHRDLKPRNVIVTPDDKAHLTDFGVAKALDDMEGMTATGAVIGSINFMSPEQITDSKGVSPRSDVYGLGGILYVAITGREPLDLSKLSMREALLQIMDLKIKPPHVVTPSIDESLSSICMRALALDPDHRQPSAASLAEELEAWLKGDRTVYALPTGDPDTDEEDEESTGLALLAILSVGILVVAAAVGYVVFYGGG
jgi:serine/threonine-protein kinase